MIQARSASPTTMAVARSAVGILGTARRSGCAADRIDYNLSSNIAIVAGRCELEVKLCRQWAAKPATLSARLTGLPTALAYNAAVCHSRLPASRACQQAVF
jgi:hypothetical protein